MPLTDSHCHLASARFDPGEIPGMLDRAEAAGVHRVVTLATSLPDLARNLELANDPRVHACIGIHPCDVTHAPDDAAAQLATHTAEPRVCAIGETGLDYFHPAPDGWTRETYHARQRDFLVRHFELAASAELNLVIHTRDREGHASFQDALAIYRTFASSVRAVFHCFAGPWSNAERVIELGGLVSFGGTSTFKNAAAIRETLVRCPSGTFLLETDAPYLAPEPHRGSRNEPAFTALTATRAAETRNETLDTLAAHTEAACDAFFRIRSEIR
ncbi:MAG: TatD family hydrolase [Luteolibacter sp.]